MFKKEFPKHNPGGSNMLVINESSANIMGVIIESDIEIAETILKYNEVLAKTLGNNGNVFDDDVKTVMDESSKDVLDRLITGMQDTVDMIKQLHQAMDGQSEIMLVDNKTIVEKYQPLLKQLDTLKFSYSIPKYTLDKLTNSEMISRLLTYLDIISEKQQNIFSTNDIQKLLDRTGKPDDIMNDIKRALLGVPSTMRVDDNFYDLVSKTLSDPSVQETKYFGDDVFNTLRDYIPLLLDIRVLYELFAREISQMTEYRDCIVRSDYARDQYYDSVRTRAFAFRKMMICGAAGLIAEVIQEKFRLLYERSVNYRKVVINTYEQGVGITNSVGQESYTPMKDALISLLYPECGDCDNQLF